MLPGSSKRLSSLADRLLTSHLQGAYLRPLCLAKLLTACWPLHFWWGPSRVLSKRASPEVASVQDALVRCFKKKHHSPLQGGSDIWGTPAASGRL